jgi:hypothetical protein
MPKLCGLSVLALVAAADRARASHPVRLHLVALLVAAAFTTKPHFKPLH